MRPVSRVESFRSRRASFERSRIMKRVFPGATSGAAALGLISASLLAGGCQNSLYEESRALHEQNRDLQATLSNTHDELQARPTEAELTSLQEQIAERDKLIADLNAQLSAPDET